MYKTLGLHIGPEGSRRSVNSDLIDSYQLVQNFRRAAHSTFLTLQPYASENLTAATDFGAAFWPSGRYARLVADYESALITGSLDLDMLAGSMPVLGITRAGTTFGPDDGQLQGFQQRSALAALILPIA